MASSSAFDPSSVNLDTASPVDIICYLGLGQNEYNGRLDVRISALFVILVVSSAATFFPVIAARVSWVRINIYVYLFARYFGAGVIIATAFVHLLDPAYGEIGPNTCVGMTGGWAVYSWPPAIVLVTVMMVFLLDFLAEQYVAKKYGILQQIDVETLVTNGQVDSDRANGAARQQQPDSDDAISQEQERKDLPSKDPAKNPDLEALSGTQTLDMEERSFQQQIAAFLILEFGVIFHSVIIGLNLGTAGSEFSTLYAVLVFHQSFEGLGIGARMSAIPFPKRVSWLPWALCTAYGLTTPIAIAIGLGLRTTYNGGSYTANVVSGVLDAISAGILTYTGLVELLARDFLFNPELTRSSKRQAFMIFNVFLGAALMALLGKWA
ncbi:high affinity zinc ion transporter [Hyaloscypha hepaticicola]|uniref:High affinity zinc ion transporter n=1 Tax=Hyaloscypha hepaticicola TaxID=2082293 RepID=A0A2J6PVH6_9HELO|nr:high affinity zinc ion transporter [Hyaloscypha hepaticicola]